MHWFINGDRHGGTRQRQGYAIEIRDIKRMRTCAFELDGTTVCATGTSKEDARDIVEMFFCKRGIVLDKHEILVLRALPGAAPGAPFHWPVEMEYRQAS